MRFTLDGQLYELTPDVVRQRLSGHSPEDIREYWTEIDGVRWPVKQVIALATGATRSQFQSQSSQRWLRTLGFAVGPASRVPPTPTGARRGARPDLDLAALDVIERLDVRVTFSWLLAGAVTLDGNGLPLFPPLPSAPGLYQFDFGRDATATRTLYIGESVDLRRRASNYRNARTDRSRQRTSRRLHKEIVGHLAMGEPLQLAIAPTVCWKIDEVLDLRLKSARRLAENAAVLLVQMQGGTRVLNIDADLEQDEDDAQPLGR
jgi:hypothetical protein